MAQTNKILLLLSFLLLNGVIAGCDSCKGEKEKLEQEEQVLMEKIKQQIRPEFWKETEEDFRNTKKYTQQELETSIKLNEKFLQDIDKIRNQITPYSLTLFIVLACILQGTKIDTPSAIVLYKDIVDSNKELEKEPDTDKKTQLTNQKIQALLADPKVQQLLNDNLTVIKVKEYISDLTKVVQNFKKQAELKK